MTVTVLLFAQARDLAGQPSVTMDIDPGTTVAGLRAALLAEFPRLADILPHCCFAVDQQYAEDEQPINLSAEIGCIPPVSGG